MKTIKTSIIISLIMLSAFFAGAQTKSFKDCSDVGNPVNFPFQNGEAITLVANYKWGLVNTAVGEATMRLTKENYNDEINFVANAIAKTYGFFDVFFKVRDHFTAKFNAENLRPSYFSQNVSEGSYTKTSTMFFDWNKKIITGKKKRKKEPEKEFTALLQNCMFDLITFVYYLRNIDFSQINEGKTMLVKFAFEDKQNDINVTYMGKTVVKTKTGKFNSLKIEIQNLENETFTSEDRMYFYLSSDKNHLPLYMEMPLKIGRVRISLSEYRNLKFPLESKIK